ncbi:HNH endonuclease [Halogeometricum sp. S1BR25-6]|uniref:HNH endonuclease n=1 Tax=Halogeometricum salsisoli TaxID=2950536 RepID=A0ABU2GLQ3_9EURY|nr:HNH endonuclease signature motif containing protein [Halogeometricum sp. S1BR25-6]MDS0301356.1 HNH endonuclease [Halogeometricum sp. S1BR25-6]
MFGGGDRYVETLDKILTFVDAHQPTTDELIGWHRGAFSNVSSRDSIMRRVSYLRQVGFLNQVDDQWTLGPAGEEYTSDYETETLFRIMCDRNVGLRSLLYELSVGPLTIEEISEQQLDTHPEQGWSRGQTDMAKQRANWLRSMGLVEKQSGAYELTAAGEQFVENAVEAWADTDWTSVAPDAELTASTYETVSYARAVDPEFRATVLSRYGATCPISGVDHAGLLDVAHVLPWSEYPDHRADLANVLPLSKIHHAAFDRELFTIDRDYRLRINPSFETQSDVLRQTIVDQAGKQIPLPSGGVDPSYFEQRNSALDWF